MADLKFTRTHEWLELVADKEEATIGITEHAQQLLGDMVFVELPQKGRVVAAGEELGVVESVKAASDFYSPISGIITEVNQQLSSQPSLVNTDPYSAGWLVKIQITEPNEINELLTNDQYLQEIKEN